jgi:hypothetical protein
MGLDLLAREPLSGVGEHRLHVAVLSGGVSALHPHRTGDGG